MFHSQFRNSFDGVSLLGQGFRTSIVTEDSLIVLLRTSRVLLSLLLVVILWGCTGDSRTTLPDADFYVLPDTRFALRVGDTVGVQTQFGFSLVRFAAVTGDSRCPENVTCAGVDAGFVTLALTVQSALAVNDVEVQVPPGADLDVTVEVEELTVHVHEVQPAAQEGVEIGILEYAALMSVSVTGDIGL